MANDPLIDHEAFSDDTSPADIAATLTTVHESRSERSQQLDEQFDAQLTTDPGKWADNPDRYDYPGVDTGPEFRDNNPGFNLESFIGNFR